MQVRATLSNTVTGHSLITTSANDEHPLAIDAKTDARGSTVNGGELLCAAIATCFCNDLFREAPTYDIEVIDVTVRARAEFGGPGDPARHIGYMVEVTAVGEENAIRDLVRHTDSVAEIHNTLRLGLPVLLEDVQVRSIGIKA